MQNHRTHERRASPTIAGRTACGATDVLPGVRVSRHSCYNGIRLVSRVSGATCALFPSWVDGLIDGESAVQAVYQGKMRLLLVAGHAPVETDWHGAPLDLHGGGSPQAPGPVPASK